MKVAAQEIENSQVVLEIEVEDERLEKAVDQAYRRIVQQINVPGFRKGKAPRALVERMVGREALVEDAVEKLVPQVVEDAVKQQELVMVARPSLEVVSTQPLQVKATVPVQPKVELGDYRALKIEPKPAAVEDEQVDRVVTRLQESNATWEPVERPVQAGDRVAIDVLAKAGETVVMDTKDAEFVADPDGPQPANVKGFVDQIVGQDAGETRTFTLPLPEDYRVSDLAGQDAEFTVTVHWVKARDLPELDDAFASTVGTDYDSMDALRSAIRDNLMSREEHERRIEHEEAVIQAVVDQATVDLPPQLVEEEADRLIQQMAQAITRQGIPFESYLRLTGKSVEEYRAEMLAQGERTVRRNEVLNAVGIAEGIEISDDEVRSELMASVESQSEGYRLVRETMKRPAIKERIVATLRRQRAARLLLETVGGVDFAALEAAAATSVSEDDEDDEGDDPIEVASTLVAVDDEIAEAAEAFEAVSEINQSPDAPASDTDESAADGSAASAATSEPSTTGSAPRQASGDTPS